MKVQCPTFATNFNHFIMQIPSSTENKLQWADRVKGFSGLLKFRLTLLVAISASFGYTLAAGEGFSWLSLCMITLGGFLITGGANALNQALEREWDAMMKRTQNRPIPTQKVGVIEAVIFGAITGLIGVAIVGYFFNLPAALLGIIGLLSYAFVYTPFKRISPFSVFIGAIPGALPPLIGWVGVTGSIDFQGLMLFAFQFFWQFPHFWAIAWIADEDYRKAGFKMLPSVDGKTVFSATMIYIYTLCLIPLPILPWMQDMIAGWQCVILALAGLMFCLPAFQLQKSLDNAHARKLMFASFWYLPLMQLTFLLGIWLGK